MHTYRINLTLEIDAVNPRAAKRLGELVGQDIAAGRRRAACLGGQGVTHGWIDQHPELVAVHDDDLGRWESEGGAVCAA